MSRNLLTSAAIYTSMGIMLAGCSSLDLLGGGGGDDDVDVAAVASTSTATPVVVETPPVEEPVAETPVVVETPPVEEPIAETPVVAETPPAAEPIAETPEVVATPPAVEPTPETTATITNTPVSSGNLSSFTGRAVFLTTAANGTITSVQSGTVALSVGDRSFRQVTNQQAQDAVGGNFDLEDHLANNPNDSIFLVEQEISASTSSGDNGPNFTSPSREILTTNGCTPGGDGCVITAAFSVDDFRAFNVVLADGTSIPAVDLISGAATIPGGNLTGAQLVTDSIESNTDGQQQYGDFAIYSQTTAALGGTLQNPITGPDTGSSGAIFGGQATPESAIEQRATNSIVATFNNGGRFEGTEFQSGGGVSAIQSNNVNLTADFGAGTVTGNISNISQLNNNNSSVGYDIGIDAQIDGNTFAGDATYISNSSQTSGEGTSQGGFFGPNAEEVAGAVQITGQAPGGSPTIGVNGGFSARGSN